MRTNSFLKKYWYVIVFIFLFLPLIFLYKENSCKSLIIISSLILWISLGKFLKSFTLSSILFLILVFPFNITYLLPTEVGNIVLSQPFVNGIIVNYLIPTLSILDLFVFLSLLSLIIEKKIRFKWKGLSFLKIFLLFSLLLLMQSIFVGSFVSIFNSFYLLLYIFTFYQIFLNRRDILKKKYLIYIFLLSIILVLFQGIVAFLQFRRGTSLGIPFLGESKVVSGMWGSSFVSLNNQLFLRGYGTFPHPNVFGGWLVFNMFLGWYLFENIVKKRGYAFILIFFSFITIFLTFSRVSIFISLLIGIGFLYEILIRNKKGVRSIAFLGLLFQRFINLGGGDTGWSDRVGLMKASFEILRKNFLIGVGLSQFVSNMEDNIPRTSRGILLLQPVHNIFLLILSELGLIVGGLFFYLLSYFLRNRDYNLRFIVVLISILIIFFFDHYLFTLPQGKVIFFLLFLM